MRLSEKERAKLLAHIEAVEAVDRKLDELNERRRALSEQKAGVFDAVRADGFNYYAFREILRQRRLPPDDRRNVYVALDAYREALGMAEPVIKPALLEHKERRARLGLPA